MLDKGVPLAMQPFDIRLSDETVLVKVRKTLKEQGTDKLDASSFLQHLLVLDTEMTNGLSASVPILRNVQGFIIELASLVEKSGEAGNISEEYMQLSQAVLYRRCADLLVLQQKTASTLPFIFYSMAAQYFSVCSDVLNRDIHMNAWISFHLLDVSAYLAAHEDLLDEACRLWDDNELIEIMVKSLIPQDGSIQRLRRTVFKDGRKGCGPIQFKLEPQEKISLVQGLTPVLDRPDILRLFVWLFISKDPYFRSLTFMRPILRSLSSSVEHLHQLSVNNLLCALDVKVFLLSMGYWLTESDDEISLCCRLHLISEQKKSWSLIAQSIHGKLTGPSVGVRLSRIVQTLRLLRAPASIQIQYDVFAYLEKMEGEDWAEIIKWTDLYANSIFSSIVNCTVPHTSSDDIFPLDSNTCGILDVDKEGTILEHVCIYLSEQCRRIGSLEQAEEYLLWVPSSLESQKHLIEVYRSWMMVHTPNMRYSLAELKEKLEVAEAVVRESEPIPSPKHENNTTKTEVSDIRRLNEDTIKSVRMDIEGEEESEEDDDKVMLPSLTPKTTLQKIMADASTNTPGKANESLLDGTFYSTRDVTTTTTPGNNSSFLSAHSWNQGTPTAAGMTKWNQLQIEEVSPATCSSGDDTSNEHSGAQRLSFGRGGDTSDVGFQEEEITTEEDEQTSGENIIDIEAINEDNGMDEYWTEYARKKMEDCMLKMRQLEKELQSKLNLNINGATTSSLIIETKLDHLPAGCLGCATDDEQDKALRAIDYLAKKWADEERD